MSGRRTSGQQGAFYALLAYGSWGIFPIYWKGFGSISPVEVISHRLVWSLVFLVILAGVWRQLGGCLRILRAPKLLGVLFMTATLLSVNWGIFVYGVNTDRVVETSLGYFICPLFNVLLGFLILRERLNRAQWIAVALAAAGVFSFGYYLWKVPWIALGIALSFGLYGLLRKMAPVDPLPGLIVETAIMSPLAAVLIGFQVVHGSAHFFDSSFLTFLFLGGGIVTAFPLIWYISAAKLLPFSTLGFFQYVTPTLQLLLGVLLYHEQFTHREIIAFALIWAAIAIFLASSWQRANAQPVEAEEIPC